MDPADPAQMLVDPADPAEILVDPAMWWAPNLLEPPRTASGHGFMLDMVSTISQFCASRWIQLNILVVLGDPAHNLGGSRWIQLNIFGDPADPAQKITPKHPP